MFIYLSFSYISFDFETQWPYLIQVATANPSMFATLIRYYNTGVKIACLYSIQLYPQIIHY